MGGKSRKTPGKPLQAVLREAGLSLGRERRGHEISRLAAKGRGAFPLEGLRGLEASRCTRGVRLTLLLPTHRSMHTPIQTEAVLAHEHLVEEPEETSGRQLRPQDSMIRSPRLKSVLSTAGMEPSRRSVAPAWSPLHD